MRKLVTIRKVKDILAIPGADNIELVVIDGWQCVVRKGTFSVGDIGLYFEIDSWIPLDFEDNNKYFFHLKKDKNNMHKIRTMKLRGALSQGLFLKEPLEKIPIGESPGESSVDISPESSTDISQDYSHLFNVFKIDKEYSNTVETSTNRFPNFIPKTDQERAQNLIDSIEKWKVNNYLFQVSLKLDGTSMTIFYDKKINDLVVCSRNFIIDQKTLDSEYAIFINCHKDYLDKLRKYQEDHDIRIALQGELVGPNIQKNLERFEKQEYFIFDIFDITHNKYLLPSETQEIIKELGLQSVPIIEPEINLNIFSTFNDLLSYASGKSIHSLFREGVVFKKTEGPRLSFKVISNEYLLRDKS